MDDISTSLFKKYKLAITASIFLILVVCVGIFESTPPASFPTGTIVSIPKNIGLSQSAQILASQHIIRSTFVYKVYSVLMGGRHTILAGDYLFDTPQSAVKVAWRIVKGEQDLPRIKVTIPEGLNVSEVTRIFSKALPHFDSVQFTTDAKTFEGYLFPDTYFFYENVQPQQIVDTMKAEFDQKVGSLTSSITSFGKSESDIIRMASIVEKEATSTADRMIVAGILWKRIADGMPLQVDPPFYYLLSKDSSQLTLADLKIDSPYNLYLHTGLPPTPIDSPSLDAIRATISPTPTPYWFYMSGDDETMHYARTYAEHLVNKAKYMK